VKIYVRYQNTDVTNNKNNVVVAELALEKYRLLLKGLRQ